MKLKLFQDIVLAENLSYRQACIALEELNEHNSSEQFCYSITSGPDIEGYKLIAQNKVLLQRFTENPEKFYIELDLEEPD